MAEVQNILYSGLGEGLDREAQNFRDSHKVALAESKKTAVFIKHFELLLLNLGGRTNVP